MAIDIGDIAKKRIRQLKSGQKEATAEPSTPNHAPMPTHLVADNRMVSQANALTRSRRDLDVIEQRCLYQIIYQVRREYVDKGDVQRDLWNNLRITLTPKQLGEVTDDKHRNAAYYSLRKLREKTVEVDNDKEWFVVGLINYARYNKSTGLYDVEVSHLLMPYIVELAKELTTYQLSVVMVLKSKYSQRLYEFCHQYLGRGDKKFFLDIDYLRDALQLRDKYSLYTGFRDFVLKKAEREIKDLFDQGRCDLWFEWWPDENTKKRKAYTRIWFKIHTKGEEDEQRSANTNERFRKNLWINSFLLKTIKRDKRYRERISSELIRDPNLIDPVFDRLTRLEKDEEKASHAPLTRYILKNDFNLS